MNSQILKLILLSCIIVQAGCDISFKRKSADDKTAPVKMGMQKNSAKITSDHKVTFNSKDSHIISSYYSDKANEIIRKDMIAYTTISKKQNSKLVIGSFISRDIQVMPLPLKLERILSPLSLHMLRVQVGTKVILMNVKSRKILDIIKI